MKCRLRFVLGVAFAIGLCVLPGAAVNGQNKQQEEPFVADYYYKAKWGYADEFIALFMKNHYPVLRKQMQTGRIISVTCVKPRYHATEDGRWDYRVTIVFKNMAAASDQASEEPIIKQLFPDQVTYKKEEQRRFEILLGHWDTPIVNVPLEK
jgi:hypothetical protein